MFDGKSKEELQKMFQAEFGEFKKLNSINTDELFDLFMQHGDDTFIFARRKKLTELLKKNHKDGVLFLWSGFELEGQSFRPESSFYHLTGIVEPGVVLALDISDGSTQLFVPKQEIDRSQWVSTQSLDETQESAHSVLVDKIMYLGDAQKGYAPSPFAAVSCYKNLIAFVQNLVTNKRNILIFTPDMHSGNVLPLFMNSMLEKQILGLKDYFVDITIELATLRHEKDPSEIEKIYEAIRFTSYAFQGALQGLSDEGFENEKQVQAILESFITTCGGSLAFPSIIAGGKNATILHYVENNSQLNQNDLLLIDCGARYKGYCSDITRTIPLSGVFTDRQKELYQIVLDTQKYIAQIAKPGYWLNNKNEKENSLQHLAIAYLQERGYVEYFMHGIGHHLGLDVHDMSIASLPLQEGDVFTIEPGLYLKDEGIGIRIEDDYLMCKDGVDCLSISIPKEVEDIEALVQGTLDIDAFIQKII